MRRASAVSLILAGVLGGGCGMAVTQERQEVAAVGRIDIIDVWGGFVIAEFPDGRRLISMSSRELAQYRPDGELSIDQAGRPLPPRASF
ncbi:MAG: hypothetical protein ACREK6_13315 [Candidatus Rokuibacteriota bacterium]